MNDPKIEVRKWIEIWKNSIKAAEKLLEVLPDSMPSSNEKTVEEKPNVISIDIEKPDNGIKITPMQYAVKKWVLNWLRENNRPATSRMLYPQYIRASNSKIDKNAFSNAVSIHIRHNDPDFRRVEIPGVKNEDKNWYTLSGWHEGQTLRQEYVDKIKKALEGA